MGDRLDFDGREFRPGLAHVSQEFRRGLFLLVVYGAKDSDGAPFIWKRLTGSSFRIIDATSQAFMI